MKSIRTHAAYLAALAWSLTSCASSGAPPAGAPTPAAPSPDSAAVTAGRRVAPSELPSSFSYAPSSVTYRVDTRATVVERGDSIEKSAPVRSLARITLQMATLGVDSLTVNARIDSVLIERDSMVPAPDSSVRPVVASFDAIVTPRGEYLAFPAAAANGCDNEEPLLAAARELVVHVPDVLTAGTQWSDSTSMTICRGGMPVTTGIVRDYYVVGPTWSRDSIAVIRLTRENRFTLAGTGRTARDQIVVLTGRGASSDTLDLDPARGMIRSATRDGLTELSFSYGGRTTAFEQRVRQEIELASGSARRE